MDPNENYAKAIKMIIVAGVAVTMVANPLAWRPWGDTYKYVDMANGLPSIEPWSSRPLIPLLASIIRYLLPVDIAHAFYYMNIMFFMLAGLLLLREHGLTTTLTTMACLSPAVFIFGAILLDAAIFFWVAVALLLRERPYILTIWSTIATAVHPMALALCGVILVFSAQKNSTWRFPLNLWYILIPAAVYILWFWPIGSYQTLLIPDIIDALYTLKMLNAIWLGMLFLRRDKESAMVIMLLMVSLGFTVFLTTPGRAFTPVALVLGPRLVSGLTEISGGKN